MGRLYDSHAVDESLVSHCDNAVSELIGVSRWVSDRLSQKIYCATIYVSLLWLR